MEKELIIKHMVCPRCIEAVTAIFQALDIATLDIRLGIVRLKQPLAAKEKATLQAHLAQKGFELLDNKQTQLINKIKLIIIEHIHHSEEQAPVNLSTLLSKQLHYDYAHLSRLFSSVSGQTIERFTMRQKIERVKELLIYDELSLSAIAFQLHYSSSAHLSAQFKKITGMTPSAFKKLRIKDRQSLDTL